jgi:hypothetical protein
MIHPLQVKVVYLDMDNKTKQVQECVKLIFLSKELPKLMKLQTHKL